MRQDIVIFGAGGFGREVMWMLEESNKKNRQWNIRGFVDDTKSYQGKTIQKYPVLGNTQWLLKQKKPVRVLCCIGDSKQRASVVAKLEKNTKISFPVFIANDVICPSRVNIGPGSIVCSSAVLTVNVAIGRFVIINYNATVCHDSIIEDFASIYPSVNVSGYVTIGKYTHLGVGSQILPHTKIGHHAVIGAGAVVTKDIPSHCIAVGIPATPLNNPSQKKKPQKK